MTEGQTIEVDTSRLSARIEELQEALGQTGRPGDMSDLVRDETRRLDAEIVRLIPPHTRQEGEKSIELDIRSLFSEAAPQLMFDVGIAHGTNNIDTWITGKDGNAKRLKWGHIESDTAKVPVIHQAARNYRGRVNKGGVSKEPNTWQARNVVQFGVRQRYEARIKKRVGRWKASWAKVAKKLGANVTGWISRHIEGSPNAIAETAGLQNGSFPVVTFGSRAPGNRRQASIIQSAVRVRSEAMKKRINLILSGYSKDVARGMRIESASKRSGKGGRYVIS